jgi:hypothetical protein
VSTTHASVQARIGRSLLRAQAGADEALSTLIRELGEVLVNQFTGLLKLVRVHDASNRAFVTPVREFGRTLDQLLEALGPVEIVTIEDQVFLNDVRIRLEHRSDVSAFLTGCLAAHRVGGVTFHAFLDEPSIRAVTTALATAPRGEAVSRTALQAQLDQSGVIGVELVAPLRWRTDQDDQTLGPAKSFRSVYSLCLKRVAQAWMALAAGRIPYPAPVRRAVLDLVDFCQGNQQEIMLVLADHALESHLAHAVHVAAISVIVGMELGLDEGALTDLGVAAIFHDAGTLTLPDRPAADKDHHAIAGVRTLMRQRGFHPGKIRRLLATAQHHDGYSCKGRFGEPRSLFARIIHIADDYDTFTRIRGIRPFLTPPAALEYMAGAAGDEYDPLLLQLFINHVGRFPPGTLLELDDGQWGLVISGVRLPRWFSKPLLRVVRRADGGRPSANETLDLAQGGRIKRIIKPD